MPRTRPSSSSSGSTPRTVRPSSPTQPTTSRSPGRGGRHGQPVQVQIAEDINKAALACSCSSTRRWAPMSAARSTTSPPNWPPATSAAEDAAEQFKQAAEDATLVVTNSDRRAGPPARRPAGISHGDRSGRWLAWQQQPCEFRRRRGPARAPLRATARACSPLLLFLPPVADPVHRLRRSADDRRGDRSRSSTGRLRADHRFRRLRELCRTCSTHRNFGTAVRNTPDRRRRSLLIQLPLAMWCALALAERGIVINILRTLFFLPFMLGRSRRRA